MMEQDRLMALEEPPAQHRDEVAVQRRTHRDDAFWRSHEQQRRRQGLSIPQYCQATGLALSTFRHRIKRLAAAEAGSAVGEAGGRFIALVQPASSGQVDAMQIEVVLPASMTLRLHGAAARQVLDRVLARLP